MRFGIQYVICVSMGGLLREVVFNADGTFRPIRQTKFSADGERVIETDPAQPTRFASWQEAYDRIKHLLPNPKPSQIYEMRTKGMSMGAITGLSDKRCVLSIRPAA